MDRSPLALAVGDPVERGVTIRRDYVWVFDLPDGLITRILGIERLSGLEAASVKPFAHAQAVSHL